LANPLSKSLVTSAYKRGQNPFGDALDGPDVEANRRIAAI